MISIDHGLDRSIRAILRMPYWQKWPRATDRGHRGQSWPVVAIVAMIVAIVAIVAIIGHRRDHRPSWPSWPSSAIVAIIGHRGSKSTYFHILNLRILSIVFLSHYETIIYSDSFDTIVDIDYRLFPMLFNYLSPL